MRRYIDRDAFWKALTSKCEEDWADLMVVYEELHRMPTYDVPEREVGKWEERETFYAGVENPIEEWQSARCSVCGKYHTTPYLYFFEDYNYCPNCGSKMKGEKDG